MKKYTVDQYINHINIYGYCILENLVSDDIIDYLSNRYIELHYSKNTLNDYFINDSDNLYQTLFGILNFDQRCSELLTNSVLFEILKNLLGLNFRLGEACSKLALPGAREGNFHTDSTAELLEPFPDTPWLINTMWMLTDFTLKNGATMLVPFSHKSSVSPPSKFNSNKNYHINAVARKGSLLIWHGGVWHANGANNTKKSKRIGLDASYSPSWWNLRREQGHQPIFNEIYVKLPKKLKNITKHKIGSNRAQCYE